MGCELGLELKPSASTGGRTLSPDVQMGCELGLVRKPSTSSGGRTLTAASLGGDGLLGEG